ncbi:ATP-binding cassette domain-containing protein, partial [Lactobacillus crispatus]
ILQVRKSVANASNNQGKTPVAFSVENLAITFKDNKKIRFPNFKIQKGEKILLTGKSGIGKSTLFKIILGELQPDTGKVVYFNQKGKEINPDFSKIGYLPQYPILFPTTVMNNITMFDSTLVN